MRVKKVRCVETGETFNNASLAEKVKKVKGSSILRVCKGLRVTAGHYHWEFVEPSLPEGLVRVKGFEDYYVSAEGRIFSMKTNTYLTPMKINSGYLTVHLRNGREKNPRLVHRLLAEAFIPNPKGLPMINHKDEDKLNNVVSNLEWCDASYNNAYGTAKFRATESRKGFKHSADTKRKIQLSSRRRPVVQYDSNGKVIKIWESTRELRRNGFLTSKVREACKDSLKFYKESKWRYLDELS